MNRTMSVALAGLTLATMGSGAMAQNNMTKMAQTGNRLSAHDKLFMQKNSEGNIAEIRLARLALKKAQHDDVKMVANMIIKGHTQAQNDLMAVAKKKNVKLPMAPNAKHRRDYAMLSKMSGEAFDKAYLKGQVRDHYATVQLFNRQLTIGQDSDARGFAQKYFPDIQTHTGMIDKAAMAHNVPTPAKFTDTMPGMGKMSGMNNMNGASGASTQNRTSAPQR